MKTNNNKKDKKEKKQKMYNIGLVMICKDESHIITESLTSIAPYIDCYCISDTGSTDNTIEIIENFFKEKNIPGKVYQDKWVNFGVNRSIVLDHGRKMMHIGVMIDADDLFRPPKEKNSKEDFYNILDKSYDGHQLGLCESGNEDFFYWRTQIFNFKVRWMFVSPLHEYPALVNQSHRGKNHLQRVPDWKILSRRLGSRNKMGIIEKYKKDAEVLLAEVHKDPLNTRNMFYLANSYRDCQEWEKSIYWYDKRVDMMGWDEERYFSLYMIGRIYLSNLNNEKLGTKYCLAAYNLSPQRAESMNALIQYMTLNKKDFNFAFRLTEKIKDITLPQNDGLFMETQLYNGELKKTYSLLALLTLQYDKINLNDIPDEENIREHITKLMTIKSIFIPDKGEIIKFPKELIPKNQSPAFENIIQYRVFNPSIAKDKDGNIMINIRCSNFDVHYRPCDKDGMIRTENFIATYDLTKIYKMIDKSKFFDKHRKNTKARVLGYEDIRLFYYNNHWCFIANNDEITGYIDQPQMVLGRLASLPCSETEWEIEHVVHLQYPFQKKVEKNWVPLIYNDHTKLDIVYSTQPLTIITPDVVTGLCFVKHDINWNWKFPSFPHIVSFRNSTQYVEFGDGFLGLCHVVYFLKPLNNQRIYYHFLVYFSKDCSEVKITDVFKFEDGVIEFANGIIIKNDECIISYSISDSIPKIKKITISELTKLFLE